MERLELPRELLTGVDDIDDHHRELYSWADMIVRSTADGNDLKKAIVFLCGYVRYHFTAEESVMDTIGFKDLDHHRRQHAAFEKLVRRFRERAAAEGLSDYVKDMLVKAFKVWFTEHISVLDRKLAEHMKSVGSDGNLLTRAEFLASAAGREYNDVEIKGRYDGEVSTNELRMRLKSGMP